jgi:hypothetical protein
MPFGQASACCGKETFYEAQSSVECGHSVAHD